MEKFKSLADAVALAEYAHRNQLDKAGFAYVEHPKRVMQYVQSQGAAPYVQIAAVLHDVPEDTAFSHEIIEALGFSEAVTKLTRLLDRDYSQELFLEADPFWDGYGRLDPSFKKAADEFYYTQIAAVPEARVIKLADIYDNLLPWRQAHLPEATQKRLQAKYALAKELLNDPS